MRRLLSLGFVLSLALGQAVAAGGQPAAGVKYRVVINHDEQYLIWLADRELPRGWKATNFTGTKEEGLQHIEEVWTDMRPLGARRKMALDIFQRQSTPSARTPAAGVKYRVVINHEEQYSIWFADRELPKGWKTTNFIGTKEEGLKHIEEVWTDMRPLGKRRAVALEIYQKLQREK